MRLFDAQAHTTTQSDDELRNLSYFGTTHIVTTPRVERATDATDVADQLRALLNDELPRLQRCGLTGQAAIGLLPGDRPRRAFPELWPMFEALAHDPRVVAIGEIGVWEGTDDQWAMFETQVEVAREANLAIVITPPDHLPIMMTYRMVKRLKELDIAPERCLINLRDEATIMTVCEEGYNVSLPVGRGDEPRTTAQKIADLLDAMPEAVHQIMLASALSRYVADVLNIAKTADALGKLLPPLELERICFANAAQLYGVAR